MTQPSARSRQRTARAPRIALALAGGGPLGAIYEIGALCALQDSVRGLDLNRCDHYVGVSAGGFIAAGLANGLTPRQLCEAFIEERVGEDSFDPAWLMRPAWREFLNRAQRVPALLGGAIWAWVGQGRRFTAFERMGRPCPPACSTTKASTSR
jgi:NTE family protein